MFPADFVWAEVELSLIHICYTKKHAEEMASFSTMEHKAALAQRYFESDVLKLSLIHI